MKKEKFLMIILFILVLISTACGKKYTVQEYDNKMIGNQKDQDVKMEYLIDRDRGKLQLEFAAKEIPLEFNLICGPQTSEGVFNLVGNLGKGNVSIKLLSVDGKEEYERFTYNAGNLNTKQHFDLYGGEYILRIEFNNAEQGKITFKFETSQV